MRSVVMLVGAAGSGKDTGADAIMREIPGCSDLKFAKALKEICCKLFGWDIHRLTDDLEYKQEVAFYPDGEPCMFNECGDPMTRRQIMQFIGTDLFRDRVRDDIWVRAALSDMDREEELRGVPTLWVLTDTRFENEFKLVQEKADNLCVIQVNRSGWEIDEQAHESEQGWSKIPCDVIIEVDSGDTEGLEKLVVGWTKKFVNETY